VPADQEGLGRDDQISKELEVEHCNGVQGIHGMGQEKVYDITEQISQRVAFLNKTWSVYHYSFKIMHSPFIISTSTYRVFTQLTEELSTFSTPVSSLQDPKVFEDLESSSYLLKRVCIASGHFFRKSKT
jgi:hypothetical protein